MVCRRLSKHGREMVRRRHRTIGGECGISRDSGRGRKSGESALSLGEFAPEMDRSGDREWEEMLGEGGNCPLFASSSGGSTVGVTGTVSWSHCSSSALGRAPMESERLERAWRELLYGD